MFLWSRGWVRDIAAAVALAAQADLAGEVLGRLRVTDLDGRAVGPGDACPEDLRLTGSISQHLLADVPKARRLLGWSDSDPMDAVRASVASHLAHPPPDPTSPPTTPCYRPAAKRGVPLRWR